MITVFPVVRLIEDKADASSTKRNMRVVYMELKFDPKYKSAVFRAKYLKSEIEFEKPYLSCVCCFSRFSELLEAVLGDFLFNGRCDVMSKLST